MNNCIYKQIKKLIKRLTFIDLIDQDSLNSVSPLNDQSAFSCVSSSTQAIGNDCWQCCHLWSTLFLSLLPFILLLFSIYISCCIII